MCEFGSLGAGGCDKHQNCSGRHPEVCAHTAINIMTVNAEITAVFYIKLSIMLLFLVYSRYEFSVIKDCILRYCILCSLFVFAIIIILTTMTIISHPGKQSWFGEVLFSSDFLQVWYCFSALFFLFLKFSFPFLFSLVLPSALVNSSSVYICMSPFTRSH